MKKENVVFARIVTVMAIFTVQAFILIFGLGFGLYGEIVQDINNSASGGALQATIYDLYYYKGADVVYQVMYSFSLFATIISVVSLIFRKNGAFRLANVACLSNIITSLFVLLSAVFEKNATIHRIIAGLYIKDLAKDFETTALMGILPIVMAVILLIMASGVFMYVRYTKIGRMSIYNAGGFDVVKLMFPVIYGCLFIEMLRNTVIRTVCEASGTEAHMVHTFLEDYYFADMWDFNVPYAWFIIIFASVALAVQSKASERFKAVGLKSGTHLFNKVMVLTAAVTELLLGIRALIYLLNPPRLFGYLTLDESLCDATEAAYPMYILLFMFDVLLLVILTHSMFVAGRGDNRNEIQKRGIVAGFKAYTQKKILILCAAHIVISILGVIVGRLAGVAGVFAACITADILVITLLIYLLYAADIRRSNH